MSIFEENQGSMGNSGNNSSETVVEIPAESDKMFDDINLYNPECEADKIPYVKQIFDSIDSAFEFYENYGRLCGFDVRRSSEKTNKKGDITSKYFLCKRAGNNETHNSKKVVQRKRKTVSAKCDCPAKLVVGFTGTQGFIVKQFIENHNHGFTKKDAIQFLRCSRSLTDIHKHFIIDAGKANIGPTRAHTIYKSIVGSYENVGATAVDFKNYSRDIKDFIGVHDAEMIIQKFKDIQEGSDGNFRFEYKTDSNKSLTHLFWADGVGRRSYDVFGDVVSFDATYRTNRYNMVFVPFIGIDNHWKSITFASALLANENQESFIWTCEAFKKIFVNYPKCIVTDQCPAMKIAIETCFVGVKHRLCMWHIMKKFPAKLGALFCAESPFMDRLNNFVWGEHNSPEEFEEGWTKVVEEFELTDNVWLKEMFELRATWIPAYFNDEPMAGLIRTTSRSESSNFFFSHFVQRGDTLSEFYLCYDSAIGKQRNTNASLNNDDDILPRTETLKNIEKDAAALYTRTMFYKVQAEILASSGDFAIVEMDTIDSLKAVKIKDPNIKNKTFEIILDLESHDVKCSCKLYTRVGYLCSHCFFALNICEIHVIPRQYVENRWLKKAEERFSTLELANNPGQKSSQVEKKVKTKNCWFEFQGCISDASYNSELLDIVHDGLTNMRSKMKKMIKDGVSRLDGDSVEQVFGSIHQNPVTVLPPNISNNKGSRKRIMSSAEKSIGGKKRKLRECKTCNEMAFHDSRNCPSKNSNSKKKAVDEAGTS